VTGKEQSHPLEPSVRLLHSYDAIPSEDRQGVLDGLMIAAKYAPTVDETYRAHQIGSYAEMVLENRYGDLADFYASLIDKNFQPRSVLDNDPQTVNKRIAFYRMIRTLTYDQIDKGVKAISLRDTENNFSEK
jgi:hypothetical protein